MKVVIHERAHKHHLSDEEIMYAFSTRFIATAGRKRDADHYPPRFAGIGVDNNGREIELVWVQLADGSILIFHANWATKQFKRELEEAK